MTNVSSIDGLEIGDYTYTRGDLCDLMNMKYQDDKVENGIYKPEKYSSVFIFSTIKNYLNTYYNAKYSDNTFIFSGNGEEKDYNLTKHIEWGNELLLFIRIDENTGFYYFGRCRYTCEYEKSGYKFPLYGLELLDSLFSKNKWIDIPEAS